MSIKYSTYFLSFLHIFLKNGVFMRLCELKQKEIINICTCKSLGCPIDLEFDEKSGKITALIVPGPGKLCCFWGRDSEYIIPWSSVKQIGEDIILVEIKEDKCFHKERLL